jgi:hypothetical protein
MESIMESMLDFVVDPETPVEAIRAVIDHAPWMLLNGVACSPSTPARILEILTEPTENLERRDMLRFVVDNPNIPVYLLEMLSWHVRSFVRGYVAQCPKTPMSALERFLFDDDASVRIALTRNPNLPPDFLERLRHDPSRWVRDAVNTIRLRTMKMTRVY